MGCKAITPHLVSLARRLEGAPFHLVASHCQRNPKEEVVGYIRGKGLAPTTPNVTVTSFGKHPQVKGNGYVPYYMVFDHTGKMAHHHMCGDYHGGDGLAMIEWVDKLLAEAPSIFLGTEPFNVHDALAKRAASGKGLAKLIADVEAARKAEDVQAPEELDRIWKGLERARDARLARIERLLAQRPQDVKKGLTDLAKEFGAGELGDPIVKRKDALIGSKELAAAEKIGKAIEKIEKKLAKLDPCKTCKRKGGEAARLDCAECRDENGKSMASQKKKLEKLLASAEGLPVKETVQALLDQLP